MTILDTIMATKRREIEAEQAVLSWRALELQVGEAPPTRSMRAAFLQASSESPTTRILAEVKEASPSKGILRSPFDACGLAKTYEENGAAAISVLTDREYFKGSFERLKQVRSVTSIPVLAKEFVVDRWQLLRARAAGADCVLLIAAALPNQQILALIDQSHALGLEVLLEVHTQAETDFALASGADILGVNNRDLKTFETSLEQSVELAASFDEQTVALSESGIRTRNDITRLESLGFAGFLIGETLVTSVDPGETLRKLRGEHRG